jgi:TRAP-type C4-dicarboxylate transport system permease large subunit
MIFFIILGAALYNGFLALSQVPQELARWVVEQGFSPWVVLAVILALYLVFGCLMDSLSMILLTIPIFFPIVSELDFGLVSLAAMQAEAAREALAAGVPQGMAPEMLETIRGAIASGAELTRAQMDALDINVTQRMADRIEAEEVAIWFGILVLIVVEVGLITPPVGMNLFVINSMDPRTPMLDTYKAVLPFITSDIIRVILLVAFPSITLFLLRWLH